MSNTTESIIMGAFLNILQRRPLNKITVKDIVEDCGVNRNTFYYHFEGIPELLERLMETAADRVINNYRRVPSLEACLSEVMTSAREHRQAVLNIYRSGFREIYERYLLEICGHLASAYIESLCHDAPIDGEDRAAMIQAYKCECYGQIINWLDGDMSAALQSRFLRSISPRRGSAEQMIMESAKEQAAVEGRP